MKSRFAVIFLFIILVLTAGYSFCDELERARALFYKGNEDYKKEKFEDAVSDYEKVLGMGFESGNLYYNLGNAYFKNGFLGKAILNYLRSHRLMPEDADLKSNLEYARSLIKDNTAALSGNRFIRLISDIADSLSMDKLTVLGSAFYFASAILIILLINAKGPKKALIYISVPVLLLTVIFASLFLVRFHKEFYEKEAVVVVQKADCKFEPFIGATTFFVLHEGEVVRVLTSEKDWIKVRRIDGKQGWIKNKDIEFL